LGRLTRETLSIGEEEYAARHAASGSSARLIAKDDQGCAHRHPDRLETTGHRTGLHRTLAASRRTRGCRRFAAVSVGHAAEEEEFVAIHREAICIRHAQGAIDNRVGTGRLGRLGCLGLR
jgi:hypothetical protein